MTEEPVWYKQGVHIWTPKTNFDSVRQMLREKYGLVEAWNSPKPGRKLVYEDPEIKIGVYCVDFREKDIPLEGASFWPDDLIAFRYFRVRRLPENARKRIEEENLMRAALVDTYLMLRPTHVTLGLEIADSVDLGVLLGLN